MTPQRDILGRPAGGLRRFSREGEGRRGGDGEIDGNRVVAAMAVASAGVALLFDVVHFAARRHLAVLADDTAAREGRETEKPNETHHTP